MMEINQNKNELHLYPINNNEYMGSIDVKGATLSNSIQTVVILDSSGSMRKETARFVKEILPLVMAKLNWNKGIDLINFSSKANWKYLTLSELMLSDIQGGDRTCFGPAIRMFRLCLESIQQNYPGQPIRVLTVSGGAISDRQSAEDEMKKLVEFLTTTEMAINSQAVRLFTSTDQPDTKALSYLLQINNTVPTSLCDIAVTSSNESIASSIADLFRSDCFANYQTLQLEKSIILKFPWYVGGKMRSTLSPGWNIFWLKLVPTGLVKLGNYPVKVIVESQLTLSKFHQLIETKLAHIIDHVAILKVVGTAEANRAVDQIFAYFKMTEDMLAVNTRNIKIVSNLLVGIAKKGISNDSAEMADFLRSTKRETEIQLMRKKEAEEAEKLIQREDEAEQIKREEELRIMREEEVKRKELQLKKREEEEEEERLKREQERERIEELERKRREKELQCKRREEEEMRLKQEHERKCIEKLERKRREEEESLKREQERIEELERRRREDELQRKRRDEEEMRLKREQERERMEELQRRRREEDEERLKREQERERIEELERKRREEDEERERIEELERKRQEEEETLKREERLRDQERAEELRRKRREEEAERLRREETFKRQEEERLKRVEELQAQREEQERAEELRLQQLKFDEEKKLETGRLFAQKATDLQHINEKQKNDFANQAAREVFEDVTLTSNLPESRKKSSLIATAANKVRRFTGALRPNRNHSSPQPTPIQTVFILHENVFVPKKQCRFAEKIVPLVFSKISNGNSQLVHLLTVVSDKTPVVPMLQSILQTLDANKPIRIMVLTDMTPREQHRFDGFAETLIKFLSGSNFSFKFQVLRIGSDCQDKLLGSRKYQLIDIDTKKSNVFIAAQIVELFHSNSFRKHEHDKLPMIDKSGEEAQTTDVVSLDVDDKQNFSSPNCESCRANNQTRERNYFIIYLVIFAIPIILLIFDISVYALGK